MKKLVIITNNPSLEPEFSRVHPELMCSIDYRDVTFLELMEIVRNKVHMGSKILTHPLDGSVKPMETPYKSILLDESHDSLDFDSLSLIENAIDACHKFLLQDREFLPEVQDDFQTIDRSLMESALDTARLF